MSKLKTITLILILLPVSSLYSFYNSFELPTIEEEEIEEEIEQEKKEWETIYPILNGKPYKKFNILASKDYINDGILYLDLHAFLQMGNYAFEEVSYKINGIKYYASEFFINYEQILKIMLTLSQIDLIDIINNIYDINKFDVFEIDPKLLIEGLKKIFTGVNKIYFYIGNKKNKFSTKIVYFDDEDIKLKKLIRIMNKAGITFYENSCLD